MRLKGWQCRPTQSENCPRPAASSPEDTENGRSPPDRWFPLSSLATISRNSRGCGSAAHICSASRHRRSLPRSDEGSAGRSLRSPEVPLSARRAVPQAPGWSRDARYANENRIRGTATASAESPSVPPRPAATEDRLSSGSNRRWPVRRLPDQLDLEVPREPEAAVPSAPHEAEPLAIEAPSPW